MKFPAALPSPRHRALLLAAILLAAACATPEPSSRMGEAPSLDLPSREKIQEIVASPAPSLSLEELVGPQPAERWNLVAPLPDTLGHVPRQNLEVWEQAFAQKVDSLDNTARSEASHCVARQTAHYVVANNRWPDDELETYIGARCGWIGPGHRLSVKYLDGNTPLDQVESALHDAHFNFIEEHRDRYTGLVDFGMHVERIGQHVAVMMSAGRRTMTVTPRPITFDEQGTLEGRVLDERYDYVRAYITVGNLGSRRCERDQAVRYPDFRFHCGGDSPTEPRGRAYVEFALSLSDLPWRDLGTMALFLTDLDDPRYVSATVAVPDVRDASDALSRLTAQLNRIRTLSGMQPVVLSEAQSQTIGKVFPHLIEAQQDRDTAAAELYQGAVTAGWDIGEPILYGELSIRHHPTNNPAKAMALILTSPTARDMLFDPRLSHLALAAIQRDASTSLLIAGYNRVPDLSEDELVARALNTINTARDAAGNRPIFDSGNYQRAAVLLSGAIARGQVTPARATERVVDAMVRNLDSSVVWWTLTARDLDDFHVPDRLVNARLLRAAVIAAPYRHPADPWSIYRVIIIYAEDDIR
ncbi:hypothetical protein EA187_12905 [Lujinxingia sediminis]|uniref:Uncharacterized protein n=1 Tax=Lujinxingia sediminis TaxID=2480984 RepID=A0ABY0CRH1_9DELT|nr:hypothetical protein [Lujinxingia sediminis]RVU43108.1 hypothetical protein EA187_12905 [Lujinxingia sediminis]